MDKYTRNKNRSIRLLKDIGYTPLKIFGNDGPFDLVGLSGSDTVFVKIIQEKEPAAPAIEAMRKIPTPASCRKLLHVWHPQSRHPEVIEVTHTQP